MSVKRYEWVACDEHSCHCDVVESAEGDMVDYEDYAALEARCAALAVENAGLKAFGDKLYSMYKGLETSGGGFHDEQSIPHQQAALDAAMSAFEEIETPTTDAFLAEVRAQGLDRLAKAWYAIANETASGISISESSRLKYRQRADDVADFANEIRKEAAK